MQMDEHSKELVSQKHISMSSYFSSEETQDV